MNDITVEKSLLEASARLLQAIDTGDWAAYHALCDESLTCFEPEAAGHLVEGLPFHRFYFDLPPAGTPRLSTMSAPHVRVLGDVGVVCYVRLVQKLDAAGAPVTAAVSETRVWRRAGEAWKHVHFHRSAC
jgi:calcium/calmodulin-dependent protein kinase (CaM kinase) II